MAEVKQQIIDLQQRADYFFNNEEYLKLALTHSSFSNELKKKMPENNERIEFLGDSVLNIIVSDWLYINTELTEGEMTKARAGIVCEASLCKCAEELMLGSCIRLGKGEILSGGRNKSSLLSDVFEALIGAVYLDGGFEAARAFVLRQMNSMFSKAVAGKLIKDHKTTLQEIIQKKSGQDIRYEITGEKGPDHNKWYTAEVFINSIFYGKGEGKTKKEAEQNAAKQAIARETQDKRI